MIIDKQYKQHKKDSMAMLVSNKVDLKIQVIFPMIKAI